MVRDCFCSEVRSIHLARLYLILQAWCRGSDGRLLLGCPDRLIHHGWDFAKEAFFPPGVPARAEGSKPHIRLRLIFPGVRSKLQVVGNVIRGGN